MRDQSKKTFRVLLVEDSPLDVKLVEQAMRETDVAIDLSLASDGEAALGLVKDAKALPYDLILLDLNLPRVNGLEVLTELRSDPRFDPLPIVVYTTSSAEEQVQLAYRKRANAYIRKPIDAIEFMDSIKSLVTFWFKTATLPHPES